MRRNARTRGPPLASSRRAHSSQGGLAAALHELTSDHSKVSDRAQMSAAEENRTLRSVKRAYVEATEERCGVHAMETCASDLSMGSGHTMKMHTAEFQYFSWVRGVDTCGVLACCRDLSHKCILEI